MVLLDLQERIAGQPHYVIQAGNSTRGKSLAGVKGANTVGATCRHFLFDSDVFGCLKKLSPTESPPTLSSKLQCSSLKEPEPSRLLIFCQIAKFKVSYVFSLRPFFVFYHTAVINENLLSFFSSAWPQASWCLAPPPNPSDVMVASSCLHVRPKLPLARVT